MSSEVKEKGDQLIEKFLDYAKSERPPKPNGYYNARQCAIIAVEEIIDVARSAWDKLGCGEIGKLEDYIPYKFWNKVLNYLKEKI